MSDKIGKIAVSAASRIDKGGRDCISVILEDIECLEAARLRTAETGRPPTGSGRSTIRNLKRNLRDLLPILDRGALELLRRGRYASAEVISRLSLRIRRDLYGEESREVGRNLQSLATICFHGGDLDEGMESLHRGFRIQAERAPREVSRKLRE